MDSVPRIKNLQKKKRISDRTTLQILSPLLETHHVFFSALFLASSTASKSIPLIYYWDNLSITFHEKAKV